MSRSYDHGHGLQIVDAHCAVTIMECSDITCSGSSAIDCIKVCTL